MTRMTPSEAFVEQLAAEGVTDCFGIVGSAYMDALDLFPPAGIRFISVAHEQNAAHLADGYARASHRHGGCIGQNGPGITNFVTAIAAGYEVATFVFDDDGLLRRSFRREVSDVDLGAVLDTLARAAQADPDPSCRELAARALDELTHPVTRRTRA